jgi:2-iminobutanoate/2-iminopropanoate deaminase
MTNISYIPSSFSPSFSEALKLPTSDGDWILVSGQIGTPMKADAGPNTMKFEDEVRTCFQRIEGSLGRLGAKLSHIVKMEVHLTDLSIYGTFSKVRGELFPKNPPTSTAVQVAGLLLGARIEITAVAYVAKK